MHIVQRITVIVYPCHQPTHSDPHFTSPETRINTGFLPFVNFYGLPLTFTPAACDTLTAFFRDCGKAPEEFDLIVTGDLGAVGAEVLKELVKEEGRTLPACYTDCGLLIFDRERQDVHAGGSGCGCSASVLCVHILPRLCDGRLKNVLFAATGALLSPTSSQQGDSSPGISHAVWLAGE